MKLTTKTICKPGNHDEKIIDIQVTSGGNQEEIFALMNTGNIVKYRIANKLSCSIVSTTETTFPMISTTGKLNLLQQGRYALVTSDCQSMLFNSTARAVSNVIINCTFID